jgi:aspartate racemase
MNEMILGILGGMGPEATVAFYSRMIQKTRVEKDQDHFRVIIDSNSKIPDRTAAILNNGPSPLSEMLASIKVLEQANVKRVAIPCITAHFYLEELRKQTNIHVLSALEVLNETIASEYPDISKIGILATTGTVKTGLFNVHLQPLQMIYPTEESQTKKVMMAIYGEEGIKKRGLSQKSLNLLIAAGNELIEKGAELIVAGCTEIGVILSAEHFNIPFLDPMDVLAEAMIKKD